MPLVNENEINSKLTIAKVLMKHSTIYKGILSKMQRIKQKQLC